MDKLKPFSNGTDAMIWENRNCDQCTTKSGCYARQQLELGWLSGEISMTAARFIGINANNNLFQICRYKDKREIKKRTKVKQIDNLQLF